MPPHSKWHKVKKMIRDAKVTATVASMSANMSNAEGENKDSNKLVQTDSIGSKRPPANKSAQILALAMQAKLKSIDSIINENTMTYNSDDEYFEDNIHRRHTTTSYLNAHNFHEVHTEKSIRGHFYIQPHEMKEKSKYMVAVITYLLSY